MVSAVQVLPAIKHWLGLEEDLLLIRLHHRLDDFSAIQGTSLTRLPFQTPHIIFQELNKCQHGMKHFCTRMLV